MLSTRINIGSDWISAEALAEFERVVELYPLDDWRWSRYCGLRIFGLRKKNGKSLSCL